MSRRSYPKPTPKQEFDKYMLAYDTWVKKEMLTHADEIEAMLQKMESSREQA